MSMRKNITGRLKSSSHLFYLCKDSKVFLLRIQTEEEEDVFILCSLSPSLRDKTREKCRKLLLEPPLNQCVSITNLKTVQISKKIKRTLMQLSKSSSIQIHEALLMDSTINLNINSTSNLGMTYYIKLFDEHGDNFNFSVLQGCCDFM